MLGLGVTFLVLCAFSVVPVYTTTTLRLIKLQKCALPASSYDPDGNSGVTYNMTATKLSRKTTILKATIDVERKTGPLYVTFRVNAIKENSAKELVISFNNRTCDFTFSKAFLSAMKISLTPDCYLLPGRETKNINLEDFKWFLTKVVTEPGKYAYEAEYRTYKGVIACVEISVDLRF